MRPERSEPLVSNSTEAITAACDRRVRNVGEDVGKPGLRIDIVELSTHDQRRHEGGTISTTIRSGEEP